MHAQRSEGLLWSLAGQIGIWKKGAREAPTSKHQGAGCAETQRGPGSDQAWYWDTWVWLAVRNSESKENEAGEGNRT